MTNKEIHIANGMTMINGFSDKYNDAAIAALVGYSPKMGGVMVSNPNISPRELLTIMESLVLQLREHVKNAN